MSANGSLPFSRRGVLVGGGLVLGFTLMSGRGARAAAARSLPQEHIGTADAFAPNAFIRIDPSGPVRLVLPYVEMGQGTYSGEAALLAEELDLGLDQIAVEHAPPNAALYTNPFLGQQATGGSTSMRAGWKGLRQAGAEARARLVAEAARRWSVDPKSCSTARGVVTHAATGRTLDYAALAKGAAAGPPPQGVSVKDPKDFRIIGKPMRRVDTADKVDGSTLYGIDVRLPGMMVATVVSCPALGGRVMSVDDRQARTVPGVREVVRLDNAVAVIGDHFWAAKCGVEALEIEWDLGPNQDFSTRGLVTALDQASKARQPTKVMREVGRQGASGKTLEAIYQVPMLAHAPMEPMNATVHVRPDACEIWVGTQVPTRCVDEAVKVTGLPADKIIVHNHYIGGGFGRRLDSDGVAMAVKVAKAVPYPVKLIWTREHDIRHDIPRPYYYDRISATLDGDGRPVAWTDRVTSDSVLRAWFPPAYAATGKDDDLLEGAAEPPYDIPNLRAEWVDHPMPAALRVGWWRGVGPTHNLFKVESFVDECAHAAGKDPVAYRRMLLHKNLRALGVLDLAADKIGWSTPLAGTRVGRGVALGAPFGSYICAIVDVEVSPQGEVRIRRSVTAVDCGIAINPNTVEAQVQGGLVFGWSAALYSQLTFEKGGVQESNFHDYRVMRLNETPPLEVHIVKSSESPGGIGEVGTAIAAPALGNAIFAATGVRLRSLPIDRTLLVADKGAEKVVVAGLGAAAAITAAAGRVWLSARTGGTTAEDGE
jgi:isoquinoline 1-oxidoreductase beta subunit